MADSWQKEQTFESEEDKKGKIVLLLGRIVDVAEEAEVVVRA